MLGHSRCEQIVKRLPIGEWCVCVMKSLIGQMADDWPGGFQYVVGYDTACLAASWRQAMEARMPRVLAGLLAGVPLLPRIERRARLSCL